MENALSIIDKDNAGSVIVDSRGKVISVIDQRTGPGYDFFLIGDYVDSAKEYLGGCSCVNLVISGRPIIDALVNRSRIIQDIEGEMLQVEINLIIDWLASRNIDSVIMMAYGVFSTITIVIESDEITIAKRSAQTIIKQSLSLIKQASKTYTQQSNVLVEFLVKQNTKQFRQMLRDVSQKCNGFIEMKISEKRKEVIGEDPSIDTNRC